MNPVALAFLIALTTMSCSSATATAAGACSDGHCASSTSVGVNDDEVSMLQTSKFTAQKAQKAKAEKANAEHVPMIIEGLDHVIGVGKDEPVWGVVQSTNTEKALGYTLLDGDCPWNNIENLYGKSLADCIATCDSNCDCEGFSWHEHGGACIPKSKKCDNKDVWHNTWSFYAKIGQWPQCGYTTTTTTVVFKECYAWGDPHYTKTFSGEKFDWMGLGIFELASTPEHDFEVHGFQVPYGYVPASAFAGLAFSLGGVECSIVGKEVTVNGEVFTGEVHASGLEVSSVHSPRDTVKFVSPDKRVHFESTWHELTTAPMYLLDMRIYMDQNIIGKEGLCYDKNATSPLTCKDSLFNAKQLDFLNPLLGPDVKDCIVSQPEPTTPKAACEKVGISYDKAVGKCSSLRGLYLDACILDYCASDGDDSAVKNAAQAKKKSKLSAAGTTTPPKYIGCFMDTWDRDLSFKAGRAVFPAECQEMCLDYKYFAIQAAVECWCGNEYGKWGEADDCDCENKEWKGKGFRNCLYQQP